MKLFLISQTQNSGYDTFDSAVVAAETEEHAKRIHPSGYVDFGDPRGARAWNVSFADWAHDPSFVQCKYLGEAKKGTKAGVICASFNAG